MEAIDLKIENIEDVKALRMLDVVKDIFAANIEDIEIQTAKAEFFSCNEERYSPKVSKHSPLIIDVRKLSLMMMITPENVIERLKEASRITEKIKNAYGIIEQPMFSLTDIIESETHHRTEATLIPGAILHHICGKPEYSPDVVVKYNSSLLYKLTPSSKLEF